MSETTDRELRLREDRLSWRALDDEVIALDLGESLYLSANASGALLWQALARGATRTELEAILVEAYEIEPDRARADVGAFLADAEERGLVE
ncbi:MAG: PqqD family protein [Nitriliruptorales bacterium]